MFWVPRGASANKVGSSRGEKNVEERGATSLSSGWERISKERKNTSQRPKPLENKREKKKAKEEKINIESKKTPSLPPNHEI